MHPGPRERGPQVGGCHAVMPEEGARSARGSASEVRTVVVF